MTKNTGNVWNRNLSLYFAWIRGRVGPIKGQMAWLLYAGLEKDTRTTHNSAKLSLKYNSALVSLALWACKAGIWSFSLEILCISSQVSLEQLTSLFITFAISEQWAIFKIFAMCHGARGFPIIKKSLILIFIISLLSSYCVYLLWLCTQGYAKSSPSSMQKLCQLSYIWNIGIGSDGVSIERKSIQDKGENVRGCSWKVEQGRVKLKSRESKCGLWRICTA